MRAHLSLAVVVAALCATAPAKALERSDALATIARASYGRVQDAYGLHELVNQWRPTFSRGDALQKLTLGIWYEALASWNDRPLPDAAVQSPPRIEEPDSSGQADEAFPDIAIPPPMEQQSAPQEAIDYAQQAITWLEAAATDGLAAAPDAQRPDGLRDRLIGSVAAEALGEIYAFGVAAGVESKGVEPDVVQAYVWFALAAPENVDTAAQNLAEVTALLSSDDRAEADRRLHALRSRLGT